MNKKVKLGIITVLVVLLLVVGVLLVLKDRSNTLQTPPIQAATQRQISGRIKDIKGNTLFVEGMVGQDTKVIELTITPQTIFSKKVISPTAAQMNSGKPYSPKTEDVSGSFGELAVDMDGILIKTQDDLMLTNKSNAIEVNYLNYNFPPNETK